MGILGALIADLLCNIIIVVCLVLVVVISIPMLLIIGVCNVIGKVGEIVKELYLWLLDKTNNLINAVKGTEEDRDE